jgi:hypothetical protein
MTHATFGLSAPELWAFAERRIKSLLDRQDVL